MHFDLKSSCGLYWRPACAEPSPARPRARRRLAGQAVGWDCVGHAGGVDQQLDALAASFWGSCFLPVP
jgi:hypothetical protein